MNRWLVWICVTVFMVAVASILWRLGLEHIGFLMGYFWGALTR